MPHTVPAIEVHPTRAKLIDTVSALLMHTQPEDITVEQVLETSGVSRGSLYHHFHDFYELIEAAEIREFSHYVDLSISWLRQGVVDSPTLEIALAAVNKSTRATQKAMLTGLRMDRIKALARTSTSERFRQALGKEQQRLTDSLTEIVEVAQSRGWSSPSIDPRSIAVLVQAYTLGRIVDDVVDNKVDEESWISLIDTIVSQVILNPNAK